MAITKGVPGQASSALGYERAPAVILTAAHNTAASHHSCETVQFRAACTGGFDHERKLYLSKLLRCGTPKQVTVASRRPSFQAVRNAEVKISSIANSRPNVNSSAITPVCVARSNDLLIAEDGHCGAATGGDQACRLRVQLSPDLNDGRALDKCVMWA